LLSYHLARELRLKTGSRLTGETSKLLSAR
jgi:hypothetical protein